MSEGNQEGYQTLGWIINRSESGIFLVIADEEMQKEIANIYMQGQTGIYDYKRYPGSYSFTVLRDWVESLPECNVFFIMNFQLAIGSDEDLRRLNFSRDMLAGLGKNLIFCTTPYGDDRLAAHVYDFYSFIKMRIVFPEFGAGDCHVDPNTLPEGEKRERNRERSERSLAQSYILIQQAKEEYMKGNYGDSEQMLLEALEIRKGLLGEGHPDTADICNNLAFLYEKESRYEEAIIWYHKALEVQKKTLGEKHPNMAAYYTNLAHMYRKMGKKQEAKETYAKALEISREVLGENHSATGEIRDILSRMEQRTQTQKPGSSRQKKAAVINDMTGFGRCALTVAIPIISRLKIQCCPVPTAILSNHMAYPSYYFDDYTDHMESYVAEWKKLGLTFDGIETGFLGSARQIEIVSGFIRDFSREGTTVLVDPIMGDNGRTYATYTKEMCEEMKKLAAQAGIVTPNVTESCILTDTPYHDGFWKEEELLSMARRLGEMGPSKVVITGVPGESHIGNYCYERTGNWESGRKEETAFIQVKREGETRCGTGDIFAAIILADAVNGVEFKQSVSKAAEFIRDCIVESVQMEVPLTDGVCFEEILDRLQP